MRRQSRLVEVPDETAEALRNLAQDLSRQIGLERPPEILFPKAAG